MTVNRDHSDRNMRLAVTHEIGKVQVVVALSQQDVDDRLEHAGLVTAEVVAGDEVERSTRLDVVVVVPLRVVIAAAVGDLLRGQPE